MYKRYPGLGAALQIKAVFLWKGEKKMTALYIILGLLAAFIVITLIRAAFFTAPKPQREEFPPEQVNGQRACDRLSQAIQIKTISCEDESQTDWGAFDRFHAFLEQSYPLIHKNLKLDHISTASLLFYWEGTDPDLDPIAFLAHQDVVPISEGTEEDWEHPAFDGVNDGQFIWGRGALDMKNHLICLMESVETLLEEGYTPKRGVYLCLGHNEEIVSGGNNGARELARELERRGVHLDSVVDEGGAMLPAHVKGLLDANLTGVGVAEKGYADFKITVKSKGGHSSQPPKHTAIGQLAKKVERLEISDYDTTVHFISEEEMKRDHSTLPHGGFVIRNGKTGWNQENTHVIEYRLKLDSNPEFTSSVIVCCARAAVRMKQEGMSGCKTILDIPPAYLSAKSGEELRKNLL